MGTWSIPDDVLDYMNQLKQNPDDEYLKRPIVALGDSITLSLLVDVNQRWTIYDTALTRGGI